MSPAFFKFLLSPSVSFYDIRIERGLIMNHRQIIMKIKRELILTEYHLDKGNIPRTELSLRKIRKLVPTVRGRITVDKKPPRISTR